MIETKIENILSKDLEKIIDNEIKFQDSYLELKKNINFIDRNKSRISFLERNIIVDKNVYHMNELLSYFDEDFIKNLYRALLKREFDQSGYDYYLDKLRSVKFHRIEIISRIYFSKESRIKGVKIKGLYSRLILRIIYKLPIIGYIVRLLISLIRLPQIIKNQENFEVHMMNELTALRNKINENLVHKNNFDNQSLEIINNNFTEILKLMCKRDKNEI